MTRWILRALLAVLLAAGGVGSDAALAALRTYQMQATDLRTGLPLPGARVTVYNWLTTTRASIFDTTTGAPIANPMTADTNGLFAFQADAAGSYQMVWASGAYVSPLWSAATGSGGLPSLTASVNVVGCNIAPSVATTGSLANPIFTFSLPACNYTGAPTIPTPTPTSLGGVYSYAGNASDFVYGMDTSGFPLHRQVSVADLLEKPFPTAATNSALAAMSTATYPNGVLRLRYSATSPAQAMFFAKGSDTCGNLGLINDGGACTNSVDSKSWLADNRGVYDPAQYGAALDGLTDDRAAFQAANDAACAAGGGKQIGSVKLARIAPPGLVLNCPNRWTLNIISSAADGWDSGLTATTSVTYITPNATTTTRVAQPWAIPDQWPSAAVSTSASASGGTQTRLTLGSALSLTVGQYVQVAGSTSQLIDGFAKVVAVASSTDITIATPYAVSSGAYVYGPVPAAMVNILAPGVVLDHPVIDCMLASGCVGVANYALKSDISASRAPTAIETPRIQNIGRAGVFTCGPGAVTKVSDGTISQKTFYDDVISRTAYGLVYTCGAADSRTTGTDIMFLYSGFHTAAGSNDINFNDVHIYNGAPALYGGPVFSPECGSFRGSGSLSNSTVDNCVIRLYASSATSYVAPAVVINNLVPEYFAGGLINSAVEVICARNTFGGCGLSNAGTKIALGVSGWDAYALTASLGGWVTAPVVTLIDSDGLYFSGAWNADALAQASRLNNWTGHAPPFVNIFSQASSAFAGTTATGSPIVTGAALYPQLGATITDSGGCIPAGSKLGFFSLAGSSIYLLNGVAATCTNASDTLTIGGVTYTGAVTSGSPLIKSVTFPTIRKGMAVTATGVPSNSWLNGVNPYAQQVSFDNVGHSTATASAAVTVTANPQAYTFQPDDNDIAFFLTANRTLTISPYVSTGYAWSARILNQGGSTATLGPLGGTSTLNASTSTLTLTNNKVLTIWSAGNMGGGIARFLSN